ncbi:hypothetical protein QJQ45_028374 [Haematococcus lacustris]|nr:hypothetical protein QJQ45_028374 [Haematococcus lacustris]
MRDWEQAISGYSRGLEAALALSDPPKGFEVLYANRAAAKLELRDWAGALQDATAALSVDAGNVKALFRAAKALQALGGRELLEQAWRHCHQAHQLQPRNMQVQQLLRQLEQQRAQASLSHLQQQGEQQQGQQWKREQPPEIMLSPATASQEPGISTHQLVAACLPAALSAAGWSYSGSADGLDTNLLLLFHGLGDRHTPYAALAAKLALPQQFGFIPGRSTMQPMFILRHLVHAQKASADAKHRKLFTAFIDFKQAYDHIPRQQLWEHLRVGVKLPQPLLACLEGLYRDDSYVLIDGPHRTPPVTPDQGVKQGCPISPLLFALYVHDISKEFLGPVDAVRVQGTPVTHFMYADDLTLVSTSSHGLQRLVCQLQGFADRKHLTVNVGKSKVMVFNGNSQTAAPSIGYKHEILPVVREFKYLGMHFNPSATPAFAATHMRAGMFLAMRQACKRAREYGVLHDPYALCHLIRAFVLPLGLYGSQTASLALGGPLEVPESDGGRAWFVTHEEEGWEPIQPRPGETRRLRSLARTARLVSELLRRLVDSGRWRYNQLSLFGFSQGGTLALEVATQHRGSQALAG